MWQDYGQALFTALGLSGVAFGVAKLVVVIGERMIEKRRGTGGAREAIARRAKLETGLEARKGERAAELRTVEGEIQGLMRRRQALEQQAKDAQRAGDQIVRLVGEEAAGTPCYIAQVLNKYVGSAAYQQKQHAFIDSSWAQPQTVEVWARSMPEARAEIERRYPPAFGFVVVRLQDGVAPGLGEPAAAAKAG